MLTGKVATEKKQKQQHSQCVMSGEGYHYVMRQK